MGSVPNYRGGFAKVLQVVNDRSLDLHHRRVRVLAYLYKEEGVEKHGRFGSYSHSKNGKNYISFAEFLVVRADCGW